MSPSDTDARPEKSADAFRTITEVADQLDVQQHVLRFWETKFSQIKPMKRAGGRRYYRPDDVRLLEAIRVLLHEEGYTIRGVQKILRESGVKAVLEGASAAVAGSSGVVPPEPAPEAERESSGPPPVPEEAAVPTLLDQLASQEPPPNPKGGGDALEAVPASAPGTASQAHRTALIALRAELMEMRVLLPDDDAVEAIISN